MLHVCGTRSRLYLPPELALLAAYRGPVAVDTETSGLRWWSDTVGVVSFAAGPLDENALATRDVHAATAAVQARMDANFPTIFHNSGFDLHFLEGVGLRIRWSAVHDTLLKARLLNNLGEHDLDALGLSYLNIPKGKNVLKEWISKANRIYKKKATWASEHGRLATYLDVPEEILMPYARRDATLTWLLWDLFSKQYQPLYERERMIRAHMYVAERDGVEVNPSLIVEKRLRVSREERAAEEKLYRIHGSSLNLDSNPQLVSWLYTDLGLSPVSWTDGGQPQVNDYSLASNPHPVTRLISTRNRRHKTGEFLDSYLTLMDGRGVVHPTINTLQARTHRFSLSDPNLQQIPTRGDRFGVREVFDAGDGWYVGADYARQEMKIAACEAHDQQLLAEFRAGIDVYIRLAQTLFDTASITDAERTASKIFALATLYGAGAPKLSESLTVNVGRPFTVEQVTEMRSNYKIEYPGLGRMMNQMQNTARAQGYIDNRWDRRLFIERERAYVATDYKIQSQGRDVLADAMLNVATILPKYGAHIVLPIHDELVLWYPTEPTEAMMAEVAEAMVCRKFELPLTVTPKKGKTLAALK